MTGNNNDLSSGEFVGCGLVMALLCAVFFTAFYFMAFLPGQQDSIYREACLRSGGTALLAENGGGRYCIKDGRLIEVQP